MMIRPYMFLNMYLFKKNVFLPLQSGEGFSFVRS